jgi:hypothetical protein
VVYRVNLQGSDSLWTFGRSDVTVGHHLASPVSSLRTKFVFCVIVEMPGLGREDVQACKMECELRRMEKRRDWEGVQKNERRRGS